MTPDLHTYDRVRAALKKPETYPHSAESIRHLETHISDVYLAGEFAYKLKKPVNLGFVDFTTLALRQAACAEELRLNRRLAPDIYLGVSTLCASNGALRLRDTGCAAGETAVDYLVRMRRMSQDTMLDALAARGELASRHLIDAARQLARFHAAGQGPDVARYGTAAAVAEPVRQNFAQTETCIGRTVTRERFERVRNWSERYLRDHAVRFEARVRAGRIVDGHGDLHLRNMCLHEGRVVIFDCIEFDPALRTGDAICDIAFLTMDLDARGLPELGNVFLNEYLERTDDYPGLSLLDFYQVYRAWVRGKVNSLLADSVADPEARTRASADATRYFALAENYLAPRAPGLLITCGLSGSGKSTLAARLAGDLNGIRVRSDAVRKHLAGMDLETRGPGKFGEGIYAPAMSAGTYEQMLAHAREIIAAGRWAILDATYLAAAHRAPAVALARELGIPCGTLWCTAPTAELRERVTRRAAGHTDISDAGLAVLEEQVRRFEPPSPAEGPVFRSTGNEDAAKWIATLRRAGAQPT